MTIYFDLETTGLNPRKDKVRVVSIDGEAWDIWWSNKDYEHVMEVLEERKHETLVAHNAQFDLDFAAEDLGYVHEGPIFDTMIAWQILTNGQRLPDKSPVPAKLDHVVEKLLNEQMSKEFQKGPWDGMVDDQMLAYAAKDTEVLMRIHPRLKQGLIASGLDGIMNLEMKLLPTLVQSIRKGIYVDVAAAEQLLHRLNGEVATLTKELPDNLNPRAPQQVAAYFNLPNAQEDTLRYYVGKFDNPLMARVMEIKKLMKKMSSVRKQILGHVQYDGRIHPSYSQCHTETGRLSASKPNLQNQDRSPDVRSLFIPSEGKKFVIADYGQLEVRITALLCQDPNLLTVLRDPDRDLHTETQTRIFGDASTMSKEEDKKTRTLSKNIMFGSLFGGGHKTVMRFAFKNDVILTEEEARDFQRQLFELYPGLKEWHKKEGDVRKKAVYSIQGRRRFIKPGEGYCTRINHPVQSSAADGQKLAMVELAGMGLIPVTNVHDEILFEVDDDMAQEMVPVVVDTMVSSMYRATAQNPQTPTVPIIVEAGVANDWSEKA